MEQENLPQAPKPFSNIKSSIKSFLPKKKIIIPTSIIILIVILAFLTKPPVPDSQKLSPPWFPKEQRNDFGTNRNTEGISIAVKGSAERVAKSRNIASVLTRDRDIEILDVSNPKDPKKIKTLDTPGFGEFVYHDGNYYYVGDSYQLQVYKNILGEPIGKFNLREQTLWPTAMTVAGGLVYIVSSNRLAIFDVTDPKNIKQKSITSLTGQGASKIIVKDGYAYVPEGLGGLNIVDVKNPASPKVVKVIPFQTHTNGFAIKGDYAYLGRVISISNGKVMGGGSIEFDAESVLEVYNITNPASPKLVSSSKTRAMFINLVIEGNLIYISGAAPHQMIIFDISDPQKPIEKYKGPVFEGGGDFQDLVIDNGFAYFGDGAFSLQIADVTNLESKKFYNGKVDFLGRGSHVYKKDNLLFVTIEKKYVGFVDVSNPEKPVLGESIRYNSAYDASNFDSTENYVYVNANGLRIYDVKDTKNPLEVQKIKIAADSIQIEDNYMFSTIGEVGILVYDITDRTSPQLVTTHPLPAQARDLGVTGKWGVATANIPYSVIAIDLSNPAKPVPKGTYKYDDYQETASVFGNLIFVPRQQKGLDILKIEVDGSLTLQKNIPGEWYAHHVAVSGKRMYLLRSGIEVYDISDPKNPKFIKNIYTKGEPTRIVTDDKYLYIADGLAGLSVIKIVE